MTQEPQQSETLVERLRKRAAIRRQIPGRKSVQEGAPDRIADLLDEAAASLGAKEAALSIAMKERDEAREDAERYRWLRSQPMREGHALVSLELMDWTDAWYSYDDAELDAAIDAARKGGA